MYQAHTTLPNNADASLPHTSRHTTKVRNEKQNGHNGNLTNEIIMSAIPLSNPRSTLPGSVASTTTRCEGEPTAPSSSYATALDLLQLRTPFSEDMEQILAPTMDEDDVDLYNGHGSATDTTAAVASIRGGSYAPTNGNNNSSSRFYNDIDDQHADLTYHGFTFSGDDSIIQRVEREIAAARKASQEFQKLRHLQQQESRQVPSMHPSSSSYSTATGSHLLNEQPASSFDQVLNMIDDEFEAESSPRDDHFDGSTSAHHSHNAPSPIVSANGSDRMNHYYDDFVYDLHPDAHDVVDKDEDDDDDDDDPLERRFAEIRASRSGYPDDLGKPVTQLDNDRTNQNQRQAVMATGPNGLEGGDHDVEEDANLRQDGPKAADAIKTTITDTPEVIRGDCLASTVATTDHCMNPNSHATPHDTNVDGEREDVMEEDHGDNDIAASNEQHDIAPTTTTTKTPSILVAVQDEQIEVEEPPFPSPELDNSEPECFEETEEIVLETSYSVEVMANDTTGIAPVKHEQTVLPTEPNSYEDDQHTLDLPTMLRTYELELSTQQSLEGGTEIELIGPGIIPDENNDNAAEPVDTNQSIEKEEHEEDESHSVPPMVQAQPDEGVVDRNDSKERPSCPMADTNLDGVEESCDMLPQVSTTSDSANREQFQTNSTSLTVSTDQSRVAADTVVIGSPSSPTCANTSTGHSVDKGESTSSATSPLHFRRWRADMTTSPKRFSPNVKTIDSNHPSKSSTTPEVTSRRDHQEDMSRTPVVQVIPELANPKEILTLHLKDKMIETDSNSNDEIISVKRWTMDWASVVKSDSHSVEHSVVEHKPVNESSEPEGKAPLVSLPRTSDTIGMMAVMKEVNKEWPGDGISPDDTRPIASVAPSSELQNPQSAKKILFVQRRLPGDNAHNSSMVLSLGAEAIMASQIDESMNSSAINMELREDCDEQSNGGNSHLLAPCPSEKAESVVSNSSTSRTLFVRSPGRNLIQARQICSKYAAARGLAKPSDPPGTTRFNENEKDVDLFTKSRRIRFRKPFPVLMPGPGPRSDEEIIADQSLGIPDYQIRWMKPKPQLKQLIVAAMGTSLQRRSNACGALKVLTSQKKNQLTLVRTDGFLTAIVFTASQNINKREKDLALDARTRAMSCFRNVCTPKENRLAVLSHPGLVECLIKVIDDDCGEAKVLACASLALLAKSPECREGLMCTSELLDCLSRALSQSAPKAIEDTVDEEDLRDETPEDDEDSFSEHSHSTVSSGSDEEDDESATTGSASEGTELEVGTDIDEPPDAEHLNSIKIRKEKMLENFHVDARSNACAALVQLSRSCAISVGI